MPRLDAKHEKTLSFLSSLDFGLEIFKEKVVGKGEDSFLFDFDSNRGIVGVFDGCGGSGSKKYERFKGKSGAYMASRVASGAAREWFRELPAHDPEIMDTPQYLKEKIESYLKMCKEIGGGTSSIKGSLSKEFPTTAAMILAIEERNNLQALCVWAGDSRCYLLDETGLKQLTEDDLGGLDAMENLSADGVLTNSITASKEFELHQKLIPISKPAILFTATDGCFGYFSTPMEFEYLLLSTLENSNSVEAWEHSIYEILREISGDDYSLSGMSLGYGSFSNLQKSLKKRCKELYDSYIDDLRSKTLDQKMSLWQAYKRGYSVYLSDYLD